MCSILSDDTSQGSISTASCADENAPANLRCVLGLPDIVLKNLLVDIEAAGGIQAPDFSLKTIVNRKPDAYGRASSQLRRQIQNKVTKLRKLTPAQYLTVLNCLGVPMGRLSRSNRSSDILSSVAELPSPLRVQQQRTVNIQLPDEDDDNHNLAVLPTPPRVQRSPSRLLHSATRRLDATMTTVNQNLYFSNFTYDDDNCKFKVYCLRITH